MADPDDDFVAAVCAHEVSHLWFGCHVSMRWWDDLWQDEAMATYMSCTALGEERLDRVLLPGEAARLPGRRAAGAAAGVLAGGQRG